MVVWDYLLLTSWAATSFFWIRMVLIENRDNPYDKIPFFITAIGIVFPAFTIPMAWPGFDNPREAFFLPPAKDGPKPWRTILYKMFLVKT